MSEIEADDICQVQVNNPQQTIKQTSKFRVFDPRVKFKNDDDKESAKIIWSSESVRLAYQAIDEGLPLVASPFFKGSNIYVRRANLLYRYEDFEVREIVKCGIDILYYADTYVQLMTPAGRKMHVTLRKYQRKILRAYQKYKYVIVLTGRQIGKTTTTAVFLSWCVTFKREMTIAVLGDKRDTSMENLNKTKDIIYNLPFFLKPGAYVWNSMSVAFDTGCKILTGSCNKSALVGKTVHILYLDELAIPPAKQSKELVQYALPTINSLPSGKCLITSTPSGDNIFKELWLGAINGINGFHAIQVNWWDVPGRDDKWKAEQLAILGEDAFNEQYNCVFLSGSRSIIASFAIDAIARRLADYKFVDIANLSSLLRYMKLDPDRRQNEREPYMFLKWHKDIVKKLESVGNLKDEVIVMTIDIGEGLGGDSDDSIINIFRLVKQEIADKVDDTYLPGSDNVDVDYDNFTDEQRAAFREALLFAQQEVETEQLRHKQAMQQLKDLEDDDELEDEFADMVDDDSSVESYGYDNEFSDSVSVACEQIGIFKSNETSIKVLALFVQFLTHYVFDSEKLKIVFERNKYGGEFQSYLLLERARNVVIEYENLAQFVTRKDGVETVAGISITPGTKPIYVRAYKDAIESNRILVNHLSTEQQIQVFGKQKNGSYAAPAGLHDDIAMTLVHLAAFMDERNIDWLTLVDIVLSGPAQRARKAMMKELEDAKFDEDDDSFDDGFGL